MRLVNGPDRLELERAHFPAGLAGTPGDGDLLLNVSVTVAGYSAADQHWVTASDWQGFLAALGQLELTRKGEAVLLGATRDEFRLRFYVHDRAGHPAVEGHMAMYDASSLARYRATFGFTLPFSAEALLSLVSEMRALSEGHEALL